MSAHNPTRGHLFIVHGRIESLLHDAAIVPADRHMTVEEIWWPLVEDTDPSPPPTWQDGWGRHGLSPNWFVEVGDGDYDAVLARLGAAVEDIMRGCTEAAGGRALPLVALPVLGIGAGGHAHEKGHVLEKLVGRLLALTDEHRIDLALVTPDPAVYTAAQFIRSRLNPPSALAPFEDDARSLAQVARKGGLALFLGAGVSIPAGLPSWRELISQLAADVPEDMAGFDDLAATDQAELLERLACQGAGQKVRRTFQDRVAHIVRGAERPSLLHVLTAALDAPTVVTTNYDTLYERAVAATGRTITSVMPWSFAVGSERWVLKLHGDVEHPEQIVLTRRHMVRYDAASRPSGALLQSLLLTQHLLVVGASLTDDNVIRLAHEVQAYREEHQDGASPTRPFGTVLDGSAGENLRAKLWEGQLHWIHLSRQDVMPPLRAVEVFLDEVGMHAADNSTWLLDPRFADLLDDDKIAEQARNLYRDLATADQRTWAPLIERLEQLGAKEV